MASSVNYVDENYTSLLLSGAIWSKAKLYIKVSIPLMSVTAISEIAMGAIRLVMSLWGLFFNLAFLGTIAGDVVTSSFVPWEWVFYIFSPGMFLIGAGLGLYRFIAGIAAYNNFFVLGEQGQDVTIRYFTPADF